MIIFYLLFVSIGGFKDFFIYLSKFIKYRIKLFLLILILKPNINT